MTAGFGCLVGRKIFRPYPFLILHFQFSITHCRVTCGKLSRAWLFYWIRAFAGMTEGGAVLLDSCFRRNDGAVQERRILVFLHSLFHGNDEYWIFVQSLFSYFQ